MNLPPYEPTWQQDHASWIVYDQREGFQPAYALVRADNAADAADEAYELSAGRLDPESETLVVRTIA